VTAWIGSFGLEQGPVAGSYEHSNKYLRSVTDREFLDQLSDLSVFQEGLVNSWS
jgi:hypothetical protein